MLRASAAREEARREDGADGQERAAHVSNPFVSGLPHPPAEARSKPRSGPGGAQDALHPAHLHRDVRVRTNAAATPPHQKIPANRIERQKVRSNAKEKWDE